MDSCDYVEVLPPADELLVKYQYISDFFIAFAYFSIPLELIYFVHKSACFPYRWVLMQFGAFIVLCGATHLINLWTFSTHSKTVAIVMAISKMSTTVVSCATAFMLVHIIPDLLSVKTRETFLKTRAEELDREMGLIIKQEETRRHVRMLTHEIRSTLDRHTILRTTLVELGRTLDLAECALWMPSQRGMVLQLSHTLNNLIPVRSTVPTNLGIVCDIFNSPGAMLIPHSFVADQVVVALSHAAILEESMRAHNQLMQQNIALDLARQEAEMAIHARNDFLSVMNHEMRTPMHSVISLSSLLLETDLNPEQRIMMETVLKCSNLLATLINDVLDISRLEDGGLELETRTFNLHALLLEVVNMIKPIAAVKKLSTALSLALDVPIHVSGDAKRLTQILLNVAGNAVKFTREGQVSIEASAAKPDYIRGRHSEFYPPSCEGYFYLHVQVRDSGCGISPQDIPFVFTKFTSLEALQTEVTVGPVLDSPYAKDLCN
ncbi:unnamed protein product [Cuscuta campestris]|uniref:histidine kinase n=1 Tax=Cuscuta campestris TaxID=132261 RepID=A0A484K759_9ASTE|nr:unnamed protein product [Cuscuta campestris]